MTPEIQSLWRAAGLGAGLTFLGMPLLLAQMARLGWGQKIREEGPKDHHSKAGTPTMGGGLFVPAGLLASLWASSYSLDLVALWVLTLGCWLLGLTDDLTKVKRDRNLGLGARQKLAIQTGLGLAMGLYLALRMEHPGIEIPWLGWFPGAGWVMLLSWLVVSATTNAVNLTDGLDGLAAGAVVSSLSAFALISYAGGHPDLAAAALGMAGATLAFLWYNSFPARIFMGDTGSMGLGGMLAGLALLTKSYALLVLVGGVYVVEAASVMLQVAYFKLTGGRRIFRMSPIHHHFCLGGMHEVQVTQRLWLCSLVLALLGSYLYLGGCL